jgi:hypothetical protein
MQCRWEPHALVPFSIFNFCSAFSVFFLCRIIVVYSISMSGNNYNRWKPFSLLAPELHYNEVTCMPMGSCLDAFPLFEPVCHVIMFNILFIDNVYFLSSP